MNAKRSAKELEAYGSTIWPGEEQQTFQRLMRQWKQYLVTMDQYNESMLAGNKTEALAVLSNSLNDFEAVDSDLNELIRLLKVAMDSNKNHIPFFSERFEQLIHREQRDHSSDHDLL
ncbi:Methyl-accepting chemotaxis protein I [Vibrio parahaemolyticus]|nr:Methyl-accepting chemotaxis protein I [Vibrio parahaemolyticus]